MSNNVELSKATIDTMKKLSILNMTLKIMPDTNVLKSKTQNGVMNCTAPIDEIFPCEFNIYDLREFISVLSLIEEPVLDFSKKSSVTIHSKDKKQKIRYIEADPAFIDSYPNKESSLSSVDFFVDVEEQSFKSILTAANTMKLEYVGFVGDGETISLVAFSMREGDEQETNEYSVNLGESNTDEQFTMFFKLANCPISVLANEGRLSFEVSSRKVAKVTSQTGKVFFIGMDTKSVWGE